MSLTRVERETGVLWNEGESTAVLWSVSKPVQRRMALRYGKPTSARGSCMEWQIPRSDCRLPIKPRRGATRTVIS